MPKVTIGIPSYNCAGLIGRAIESALAQTYEDLEVLVVDDCSTDNTPQVMETYLKDPRVRYVRQGKNVGVSANKNTCMKQAQGEYVFLLDSDDILPECSVQAHLEVMEPKGALWASCDLIRRCGGRDEHQRGWFDPANLLEDTLVRRFPYRVICYHKKALEQIGYHDETLGSCEDWDLIYRMVSGGVPGAYVPQICYIYCIQQDSVSKGKNYVRHLRSIENFYEARYRPLVASNHKIRDVYAQYTWELAGHLRCNKVGLPCFARAYLRALAARPGLLPCSLGRKLKAIF